MSISKKEKRILIILGLILGTSLALISDKPQAQERSRYMQMGDLFLTESEHCSVYTGKQAYALQAIAAYIAALKE